MIETIAELYCGDCLTVLSQLEANSIDTVITDPPYGLSFMNASWDCGVPGKKYWEAILRVAKPGATLLAFGGTRMHHRLMVAIEDAGWEIRDCLMWLYGTGFPKSHDISKAIDKAALVDCPDCNGTGWVLPVSEDVARRMAVSNNCSLEKTIIGLQIRCQICSGVGKVRGIERKSLHLSPNRRKAHEEGKSWKQTSPDSMNYHITTPATEAAQLWDGWGTGLKPAWEPIIVAMKPRDGTFAQNALAHGVAGMWIDGSRVGVIGGETHRGGHQDVEVGGHVDYTTMGVGADLTPRGRWPANLLLSHMPDQLCFCMGDWPDCPYCSGSGVVPGCKMVGTRPVGTSDMTYGDADGLETIDAWECVEGCPVRLLGEQSGKQLSQPFNMKTPVNPKTSWKMVSQEYNPTGGYSDAGTAARFFQQFEGETRFCYSAKASRKERNAGLEGMEERESGRGTSRRCANCGKPIIGLDQTITCDCGNRLERSTKHANFHPTVKPIKLMRYLCRLTKTPTGGVVLDPFMGSGSTGVACLEEWRDFIGIEIDPDTYEIAYKRMEYAAK